MVVGVQARRHAKNAIYGVRVQNTPRAEYNNVQWAFHSCFGARKPWTVIPSCLPREDKSPCGTPCFRPLAVEMESRALCVLVVLFADAKDNHCVLKGAPVRLHLNDPISSFAEPNQGVLRVAVASERSECRATGQEDPLNPDRGHNEFWCPVWAQASERVSNRAESGVFCLLAGMPINGAEMRKR